MAVSEHFLIETMNEMQPEIMRDDFAVVAQRFDSLREALVREGRMNDASVAAHATATFLNLAGDADGALRLLRVAEELGSSPTLGLHATARHLISMGRVDEAAANIEPARGATGVGGRHAFHATSGLIALVRGNAAEAATCLDAALGAALEDRIDPLLWDIDLVRALVEASASLAQCRRYLEAVKKLAVREPSAQRIREASELLVLIDEKQ